MKVKEKVRMKPILYVVAYKYYHYSNFLLGFELKIFTFKKIRKSLRLNDFWFQLSCTLRLL